MNSKIKQKTTSTKYEKVYLSIGSNLGDKHGNVRKAMDSIDSLDNARVMAESSFYSAEPIGQNTGLRFTNCAVEIMTCLSPMELLDRVEEIELSFGRKDKGGNKPRSVDIDILLYGDHIVSFPRLKIPHPRMAERRFVLEPLAEIAPDAFHPALKATAADLRAKVTGQKVSREEFESTEI